MAKSLGLTHVAMGVPVGTLTESYRTELLDFYGDLLGWREIKRLRLPERLTISVGDSSYINLRERPESIGGEKYEHFGVLVGSSQEVDDVWESLRGRELGDGPVGEGAGGSRTLRFQHLLPFAVEVQWFPSTSPEAPNVQT
jgi:glyoxalase/bleomycin resistance protein/dioxygenase superfamily protein